MSRYAAVLLALTAVNVGTASAQEAPPPLEPHAEAFFDEPGLLTSAFDFAGRFTTRGGGGDSPGFYPKVGGMISGAGWISAGPGVRTDLFGGRARAAAYATVSWRGYVNADTSLEFPLLLGGRLAAGTEALWQDSLQVNYFGLGPDSSDDLRSQYRLQTMNVVGYARYRPQRWLALSAHVGWLDQPSIASATGFFKPDYLDAQTTFPDDPAMSLGRQPEFVHWGAAVTTDTRDHADHPTRGGLYRASAGGYTSNPDGFGFRRYETEGLQAFPFFDRTWVVAVHGWGVFSNHDPTEAIPFYLMPGLGGANTLRGYSNYRFHDRHLLLANVESRWAIWPHMDAAVFVDAGTVAARVEELGFDKRVYGFGIRIHADTTTVARVDVSSTEEGWTVLFRSYDALNLKRLKNWMAAVPFVP
jgi:hypothetical protein